MKGLTSKRLFWMRVLTMLLALVFFGAFLAGCTKNDPDDNGNDGDDDEQQNNNGGGDVVDTNNDVHYSTDNRDTIYAWYTSSGTQVKTYNDLYKAMTECVDEGDFGDYIAKISDPGNALFTYAEEYNSTSADQYFYYEYGTSIDRYTPWTADYITVNGSDASNDIIVHKTSDGLAGYYQGYSLVGLGAKGGSLATWNEYPLYEAGIQVDLEAYVGVTKVTYEIDLSEARIYPQYEGYATTYAQIGFILPDAYNVASFGLAADVSTGNFYYYWGDISSTLYYEDNVVTYDTSECYLTSTWNEAGGYYTPDADVVLTAEIITMTDGSGDSYYVDRLTMEFSDGRTVTRDYEDANMTACSTCRFNASLNIMNSSGMPLYDCGAQFTNLVITSATGTVYQEIYDDPDLYGGNVALLDPGDYDLLNSNPASDARYQTLIYNGAVTTYDFSTAGKDVYNFSFAFSQNANTYSTKIQNVKNLIAAIPDYDDLDESDRSTIEAARSAYNALANPYQTCFITDEEYATLQNAEIKLDSGGLSENAAAVYSLIASLSAIGELNDSGSLAGYSGATALVADGEAILEAYNAYNALTADEKAELSDAIVAKLNGIYTAYITASGMTSDELSAIDNALANATGFWKVYVDEYTYTGVADFDNYSAFYAVYSLYNALSDAQKAVYDLLDNGITAWAIEHYLGEYAKIDAVIAAVSAVGYTSDMDRTTAEFQAALANIVELFNEFDNVTSWAFRTGTGYTGIGDGIWWQYAGNCQTAWDTLQVMMDGYYVLSGFYLVTVESQMSENAYAAYSQIISLGEYGAYEEYNSVADLLADKDAIAAAYNAFTALTDDEKAEINATLQTKIANLYNLYTMISALTATEQSQIDAILAKAAGFIDNYVDENTYKGVADFDSNATFYAVYSNGGEAGGYKDFTDAQKAVYDLLDDGITAWAIAHYLGEYAKIDAVIDAINAVGYTSDMDRTTDSFQTALANIVALFNTFDEVTSWAFRTGTGYTGIADGIWWQYSGKCATGWSTLQLMMDGYYVRNGYYLERGDTETVAVYNAINALGTLSTTGDYTSIALLLAAETDITSAYNAYMALTTDQKAILTALSSSAASKIETLYELLTYVKTLSSADNLYTLVDASMSVTDYYSSTAWQTSYAVSGGANYGVYDMYAAYNTATAAEIAALPGYITGILSQSEVVQSFAHLDNITYVFETTNNWYKAMGYSLETVTPYWSSVTGGWYSEYMTVITNVRWVLDDSIFTSEQLAKVSSSEVESVLKLLTSASAWGYTETWNFRVGTIYQAVAAAYGMASASSPWTRASFAIIYAEMEYYFAATYSYNAGTGWLDTLATATALNAEALPESEKKYW